MITRRKVGWTLSVLSSVCLLGAVAALVYVNYCPKNIITSIAECNIAAFIIAVASAICLIIGIVLIVFPSQSKPPVNDKDDTKSLPVNGKGEDAIPQKRYVATQTDLQWIDTIKCTTCRAQVV